MTEHEPYRDNTVAPAPVHTDVYRETIVDDTTNPPADATRNIYQERVSGPAGEKVTRSEQISIPSDAARRDNGVIRIKQVIYFIFGIISVLLVIRFVLLVLGANVASPFVNLIDNLTQGFVNPFRGIFADNQFGASVFEWSALMGILIYSLIAYGLARIVELFYASIHSTVTRNT